MQRLLTMLTAISDRNARIVARSTGVAAASALFLLLGSLAQPAAASGIPCGGSITIAVADLCSSEAFPNPGNPTTFDYDFGSIGGGTAYIPLLDPNAIVPGTFMINDITSTPTIIAGATVATDWGSCAPCTGDKSAFADPAALIGIILPDTFGEQTSVSFESNDPVVSGPILVGATFIDPPLPGSPAIPEPGTLALLGAALGGVGFCRRRRNRA